MKHPVVSGSWRHGWLLACLPLLALAKAPPSTPPPAPVKAVPLNAREQNSLMESGVEFDKRCDGGTVFQEHSFHLQQKGGPYDGALFLTVLCNGDAGSTQFGFMREGKQYQPLPNHPANRWLMNQVEAVSFPDVNGDGRFDIVTLVSTEEAEGHDAEHPLMLAAVWFQGPEGQWTSDPKADELLGRTPTPNVKAVLAALKKLYARK